MDLQEAARLVLSLNLADEPAVRTMDVQIHTIPPLPDGRCPLALYFPDRGLAVIPPDGTPDAVIHEIGHRVGHYYHRDLSEPFAEAFRAKYRQGPALLYQGADFSRIPRFAALFKPGEQGKIVYLRSQPPHLKLEFRQDGKLAIPFVGMADLFGTVAYALWKL